MILHQSIGHSQEFPLQAKSGGCSSNRYIFDPGIRFYPELIPNMALDLGFVGDGEFEFSFGISYMAHL